MSEDLTEAVAWELVEQGVKAFDELDDDVRKGVSSIVVYNSLVRGDFTSNASDIDVLLVLRPSPDVKTVDMVQECFTETAKPYRGKSNCPHVFDIPWLSVSDLPLKEPRSGKRRHTLKSLGIYAFDFVDHSEVLRGEDFRQDLDVKDPMTLVQSRANELQNECVKYSTDERWRVVIVTGELVRLAQIRFGERTLDKRIVYKNFKEFVPHFEGKEFIDMFWDVYTTGGFHKMDEGARTTHYTECVIFNDRLFELLDS